MSRLAELQAQFQQCLLAPPDGSDQPWVRAGGRASPARQLSAYQYAYPARLKEVLGNDYPAVWAAIGDVAFDRLAEAYLRAHPSRFFSLRDFGGRLADFVDTDPVGAGSPWLTELARFEWALGLAFDAADAPLAGIADMAAIAPQHWPALRFDGHPSIQRLDLIWDTPAMWSALTADPPRRVSAVAGQPTSWLIWRDGLVTRFRSLATAEAAVLDALLRGDRFADLCVVLGEHLDAQAVPLRAASLLKGWLDQGLISAIGKADPG